MIMSEARRAVNPVRRGGNPGPPGTRPIGPAARSTSAPTRQPGPSAVRRPAPPATASRVSKFVRPLAVNRDTEDNAAVGAAVFGRLDINDDDNSAKVPEPILKQVSDPLFYEAEFIIIVS